jgi:hypothetical protein
MRNQAPKIVSEHQPTQGSHRVGDWTAPLLIYIFVIGMLMAMLSALLSPPR